MVILKNVSGRQQQQIRVLRGAFFNYVDNILAYFDHLPSYVDIFYLIRVDQKVDIFWLPTHLFLST